MYFLQIVLSNMNYFCSNLFGQYIGTSFLSIVIDEDHLINQTIEGSVSAQMANETNMCTEESWAVRTRNSGSSG